MSSAEEISESRLHALKEELNAALEKHKEVFYPSYEARLDAISHIMQLKNTIKKLEEHLKEDSESM